MKVPRRGAGGRVGESERELGKKAAAGSRAKIRGLGGAEEGSGVGWGGVV